MEQLPKPWFDMRKYREVRLKEALYEADLAESFLSQGLTRNAAGKFSRPGRPLWLPTPWIE